MFPDWASWLGLGLTAVAVLGILPVAIRYYRELWSPYSLTFRQLPFGGSSGEELRVRLDFWNRTSRPALVSIGMYFDNLREGEAPASFVPRRRPSNEVFPANSQVPPNQHETIEVSIEPHDVSRQQSRLSVGEFFHGEYDFVFPLQQPTSTVLPSLTITSRDAKVPRRFRKSRFSGRRSTR